jgi:predicted dehydrogenase
MLADAHCDGVIICTPTEHHLSPTMAALDARVPVLVEKPICATVSEAEKIIAKSAETGVPVLVAHQRRYYPQVDRARALIQEGALGQLIAVSGQWTLRKPDAYYDPDWRKRWQAGPVVTNLIHDMDAIRYICGEVESVMAETANPALGFEKEDVAALVIRFDSGALGSFILSDQATSPWGWEMALGENISIPKTGQNAMRFMGRDAALEFPNLVLWRHSDMPHDWSQPFVSESIPLDAEDAYIVQLRHFAEVIRGEAYPRIDAADATRSLAATVAVLDSARSGKRVVL